MPAHSELIHGVSQQRLFSPKGAVEGVLLKVKGLLLQVSLPPDVGTALAPALAAGKRLRVWATADHSPKTQQGVHPVYQFDSLADAAGQAVPLPAGDADNTAIKGVVAALHYARHGQPNGVLLEGGEFIHLRPHGMQQLGLEVGAKVVALGTLRMTVLGTRMLEARQVNRVAIA